jgi:hypothetical protein
LRPGIDWPPGETFDRGRQIRVRQFFLYPKAQENPTMKTLIATLLLVVTTAASADVLVVNIWQPLPGQAGTTFQYGQEAKAIHEKLGARVMVAADLTGQMHYGLSFENWAAWAAFGDKLAASADWTAFLDRINANPSAIREEVYMMDQVAPLAVGGVYEVGIWTPNPGRTADTVARAMEIKALHEKAGAKVGVNVDQMGRVHYVLTFENWAAWGKFQDTPNPDVEATMARFGRDSSAALTQTYLASQL